MKIIEAVDGTPITENRLILQTIKKCFRLYGIIVDNSILEAVFHSNQTGKRKSCKKLRNEIFHSLSFIAVCEVRANLNMYVQPMDTLLEAIRICT